MLEYAQCTYLQLSIIETRTCEQAVDQYHIGHSRRLFFQPVNRCAINLLQQSVPLREQHIRKMTIEQDLSAASEAQYRNARRYLVTEHEVVVDSAEEHEVESCVDHP